jgi:hypothetical protein
LLVGVVCDAEDHAGLDVDILGEGDYGMNGITIRLVFKE